MGLTTVQRYCAACDKAYRVEAISMTLSDVQGNSSTASLFKCDFSYSCAAVDKVSTGIVRRAFLLR